MICNIAFPINGSKYRNELMLLRGNITQMYQIYVEYYRKEVMHNKWYIRDINLIVKLYP